MAVDEIRAIYEEYAAEVEKLVSEKKLADGLFGMGKKIADDPCHDRFSEKLGTFLKEYASGSPDQSEIRVLLEYIYSVQKEHKDPVSVYWMMNAAHGFTLELIEKLSREDAAALYEHYEKNCPRSERFPVQKKVLKALKSAAK